MTDSNSVRTFCKYFFSSLFISFSFWSLKSRSSVINFHFSLISLVASSRHALFCVLLNLKPTRFHQPASAINVTHTLKSRPQSSFSFFKRKKKKKEIVLNYLAFLTDFKNRRNVWFLCHFFFSIFPEKKKLKKKRFFFFGKN